MVFPSRFPASGERPSGICTERASAFEKGVRAGRRGGSPHPGVTAMSLGPTRLAQRVRAARHGAATGRQATCPPRPCSERGFALVYGSGWAVAIPRRAGTTLRAAHLSVLTGPDRQRRAELASMPCGHPALAKPPHPPQVDPRGRGHPAPPPRTETLLPGQPGRQGDDGSSGTAWLRCRMWQEQPTYPLPSPNH